MALAIDSLTSQSAPRHMPVRRAPVAPTPTPTSAPAKTAATATTSSTSQKTPAQSATLGSSDEAPSFAAAFVAASQQLPSASSNASLTAALTSASSTQPATTTPAPATTSSSAAGSPTALPSTQIVSDPGSPFGPNPFMTDPTGYGPAGSPTTHYNPVYFATQGTAQTVAQMLGGTVVQDEQLTSAPGSPFQQDEMNYMVQLPGGGLVNPGFIADIYTHGWSQSMIDQQVQQEVAGAQASVSS